MADYILTDGKSYVTENPYRTGDYLLTTYPNAAKRFSFKQAKGLTQRKGKKYTKFRDFTPVNIDNGEKEEINPRYEGKADIYTGEHAISVNANLLDNIIKEANTMMELTGWNREQLKRHHSELMGYVSYYESAESDIVHSLQKYNRDHNGKKPQAHRITKIGYLLDDIRHEREKVKLCIRYLEVLVQADENHYSIEKVKDELSKTENKEYRGRTDYWQEALDILYK